MEIAKTGLKSFAIYLIILLMISFSREHIDKIYFNIIFFIVSLSLIIIFLYKIIKLKRKYKNIDLNSIVIKIKTLNWIRDIFLILILTIPSLCLILGETDEESFINFTDRATGVFLIIALLMNLIYDVIDSNKYINLEGYLCEGELKSWNNINEVKAKRIYFGNAKRIYLIGDKNISLIEVNNKDYETLRGYIIIILDLILKNLCKR
ncbi:hypothetical protein BH721_02245 [Clostridium baratii]|uniref:hypothetical protein n=1 Tax=Clostridium baratii TaxID=1561 RepID=UPI0009A45D06|nr:hypothetical protein [Clostridium baratii]OPF51377.1 hypothetical protein A1M12_02230 [Clostridium baratii]OPF55550.1 hypothetical protein BH721_02245 [Clostridium baratii]OPF57071.1 hypothetical protein BH724_11185 [Clostridium baratii]OPF60069.1 hypothetical protein BH725_05680 [Clostridium baratii]